MHEKVSPTHFIIKRCQQVTFRTRFPEASRFSVNSQWNWVILVEKGSFSPWKSSCTPPRARSARWRHLRTVSASFRTCGDTYGRRRELAVLGSCFAVIIFFLLSCALGSWAFSSFLLAAWRLHFGTFSRPHFVLCFIFEYLPQRVGRSLSLFCWLFLFSCVLCSCFCSFLLAAWRLHMWSSCSRFRALTSFSRPHFVKVRARKRGVVLWFVLWCSRFRALTSSKVMDFMAFPLCQFRALRSLWMDSKFQFQIHLKNYEGAKFTQGKWHEIHWPLTKWGRENESMTITYATLCDIL